MGPPPQEVAHETPRFRARRARTFKVAFTWIAAAIVALAVVGVALVMRDGSTKSAPMTKSKTAPPAIYRKLMTPFTVNGARFKVQPANSARWAARVRSRPPRFGRRWVTVSIPVRNLSRADLRPRRLGYRIVTPAGFVVGPETVEFRPGSLDGQERLAKGELTSVHLAFQVRQPTRDLTLALDAGGIRQPAVRVPLGAEG